MRIRSTARRVARWGVLTAVALGGLWPAGALAQKETTVHEEKKPFKQWIVVLVATGLIVAIAVKNPKRTHLG